MEVPVEFNWWQGKDPKISKFRISGWRAVCTTLDLRVGQIIELDLDPADSTRLLLRVLSGGDTAPQLPEAAPLGVRSARQPMPGAPPEEPPIGATVKVRPKPKL